MKIKSKVIAGFLIFAIFALAILLRVCFSYGTVMSEASSGFVKYSADDGVYHMRLVENELLGGHFPFRIYFDPFTYFPNGTYIHFGPLYDWLLCLTIWLATFGHPTLKAINAIAPFVPAVMGSLVVFLVYFIAKKLWSKPVALFSALLIAIFPTFLFRSLLGNTDHHVAEVFFSTLTMLFLFYLTIGRKSQSFKEAVTDRKFWLFTILTGVSMGLYFLTWTGALLFLFIVFCFACFYYIYQYFFGHLEEWVLLAGTIIFLISLLMISPFFGYPDFVNGRIYNLSHFLCFLGGILVFFAIGILGRYLKSKNKKPYFLPLFLFLGLLLGGMVLKFVSPLLFDAIIRTALEVNYGYGKEVNRFVRQFIGEMSPLGFNGAFNIFSAIFWLSMVALGIFIYRLIKQRKPEYFLLVIWTLIILFVVGVIPFFGQNRNAYYLCVNIALLGGFLIAEGFKFGWKALEKANDFEDKSYLRFYFNVTAVIIIFNIVFFTLYPFPFNIYDTYPESMPNLVKRVMDSAKSPGTMSDDWYETLKWLKNNTPDPGVDYYAFYKAPAINGLYQYPSQAYGVLAKWDVGHDITYYSHRIPTANPFQEGIGKINDDGTVEPGEGTFFLETNEKAATGYLDTLRAKYVIIDSSLSDPNGNFRGYVNWINGNMESYTGGKLAETEPTKYDLAMSTRLYFLDGSYASMIKTVKKEKVNLVIPSLSHFRLVYESKTDKSIFLENDYKTAKQVKVFEYVKGATIKGKTQSGAKVEISTNIKTNQAREFVYQSKVFADKAGNFEFVVPYSADYAIKTENYVKKIKIFDDDVSQGKIINI